MDDLDLSGGTWWLRSARVDGQDVTLPEGAEVSLEVIDGQAVGRAACNRYGAALTVTGDAVRLGPPRRTIMACEAPLLALEHVYLLALERVEAGSRDGGAMTLSGPGVHLQFSREG